MLFCISYFFYKQEKLRECYKCSSKFHFMVYFLQLIKLHVPCKWALEKFFGLSSLSCLRECITQIMTIDGCRWKRLTLTRTPRTCLELSTSTHCRHASHAPTAIALLFLIHTFKIITNASARPHPSVSAVSPLAFVC